MIIHDCQFDLNLLNFKFGQKLVMKRGIVIYKRPEQIFLKRKLLKVVQANIFF